MEKILKYLFTLILIGIFSLSLYYFIKDIIIVKVKIIYKNMCDFSRVEFTESFKQLLRKNSLHAMGLTFFFLSICWNIEIKKLVGNLETIYYILLLMLYYFIYMGCLFRKSVSNMGKIPVIIFVAIILVFSLTPIYINLLLQVQYYMDFGLVIISLLFCSCLSFILAKTMLDKFSEKLSKLLINSFFFWLLATYTLMIFGTYDILMDKAVNNVFYEGMTFTQSVMATIRYGAGIASTDIFRAASFDRVFQGVTWALGTLIIANTAIVTLKDTDDVKKEEE